MIISISGGSCKSMKITESVILSETKNLMLSNEIQDPSLRSG